MNVNVRKKNGRRQAMLKADHDAGGGNRRHQKMRVHADTGPRFHPIETVEGEADPRLDKLRPDQICLKILHQTPDQQRSEGHAKIHQKCIVDGLREHPAGALGNVVHRSDRGDRKLYRRSLQDWWQTGEISF